MNNKLLLGLTGSMGSGKSTVAEILSQNHGFYVIDADKVAREVMLPVSLLLSKLAEQFGEDILLKDGSLDRRKLAEKAFSSKESTEKLNALTHPAIIERINALIGEASDRGETRLLLDAPLLFESGLDKICNCVLSVLAKKEVKIKRVMLRDGISEQEVCQRLKNQKSDAFYREHSDFVIVNNSDGLIEKVNKLITSLKDSGYIS